MPDAKITALTAISVIDPAVDPLPIVDVSDTAMAASGTTKKITINQILGASGTATLAAATITGNLTVDTNTFFVDSVNNRVGVGTATPITPWDVRSNGNPAALFLRTTDPAAAVASAYIQAPVSTGFSSTVPVYGFWYQNSGMGNPAADTLNWIIASGEAMRLNSTGLGVGVTPSGGNRLMIQNTTDCTVVFKSSGANVNSAIDYVSNYGNHTIRKSGTAVWDFGVVNDVSATPAFKVSNASSVGVQLVSGATAWTTLSDETVKDIIEPISNAVSKVGSLRSVIGKFKTDDSSKRRSFLIAQDVQSVLPEAVDVIGENNELGLRYTEVIPLLVAAIKELTAEVNALKNA